MNQLHIPNYNLNITLLGGQAFGWDYFLNTNEYFGVTNSHAIKIKVLDDENILWQTYPKNNDFEFLSRYLNLNVDYQNILNTLPNDEYLKKAKEKFFGLRILKQDFQEALMAYICSSNKSIKGIRYSYRLLCKKFGKKIDVEGKEVFLFPKPKDIANTSLEEILETKVGFRGKYLKEAAKYLVESDISKRINALSYDQAREELIKLRGVGDKIVDCVLVYGVDHNNITPLDIWGKRFLIRYYGLNEKMKYSDMRKWASNYFNGYASYGGQYLFEYIRSSVKDN